MCSPMYIMGVSDGEVGQHHSGRADGEQVKLWLKPDLH